MCCLNLSNWFLLGKEYLAYSITVILLLSFVYFALPIILRYICAYSDVDEDLLNSLHRAVMEDDAITTFKLVQKCPKLINIPHQIDGYSPFMRACLNAKTQLVRIMLNFSADISLKSSKGETPFYLAVFYHIKNPKVKDATCIHALYYAGSDINACNYKGYSPLQLAAMFGHKQLVMWLLNKGHYETAMIIKRRRLPVLEQLRKDDEIPRSVNKKKITIL
ncbi:hypothetical protein ILUMI_06611 [Ignelater luminosus]|uniref:Ankyrin repeat domain-containing protein n=1 Tax=Ignelater luminosus TaxID=2038154 RepID=A0A8K0D8X2_IGNLU|nr:hypothetical protein ILUMI_06611 [Ignelater luminosus]